MYSKDKVRRTVIRAAVAEGGVQPRGTAQRLGISEGSLRRELDNMVMSDVLEKQGRIYRIRDDIAAVIIKARRDKGEVVGYSREEKVFLREPVSYSEAQTYESNVLTLCKTADRYKRFLQKKYKNVVCGIIYSEKEGAPYAVRELFDSCLWEKALVSKGLGEEFEGSALCVSESSLLCAGGNAVCDVNMSGNIAEALSEVLEHIRPERVFVDSVAFGDRFEDIARVCGEKSVECVARSTALSVDELEMLAELITKICLCDK